MTADERRGVILDIICARRYETIDNLAFELDASRRTIERDVLHLSLRFPIYTMQGKAEAFLSLTISGGARSICRPNSLPF